MRDPRALLRATAVIAWLLHALPAAAADLDQAPNLLGGLGGLRPTLAARGITLGLTETSEVLGNLSGGVRRGAEYDGLTQLSLAVDTSKAFGWPGGTFDLSALQIHGRSLSATNLDNLQTVSGISGDRSTRLWELWFQQSFLDGKADVRVGQQSLDQEFIVSQYSGLYLNTMMGWPMLPSADLYAGGPAYPLSSLGVRLRTQPTGALTLLGGVFDDNPPGGSFADDAQRRGREAFGTRFNLNTGALVIAELQYAVDLPAASEAPCSGANCGLPGTYRLGAWYDTARFPDPRFDAAGRSLADPASDGRPFEHRRNFSVYGVVDQMLWRESRGPSFVAAFARIMGAPGDRNPIDLSINAGINVKAPLPGRDDDSFGVGYGVAHVSAHLSALDRDSGLFSGRAYPVRSAEHFVELTYQWQAAPWWIVQPDLQYIFNPGAGVADPVQPTRRIADELVLGVRTVITF
ncbi:MAG: carbohydrate porin [Betaproteobacteria bacterium]|nr:carbohydrate porin [Betaproteobacteria bacterium]